MVRLAFFLALFACASSQARPLPTLPPVVPVSQEPAPRASTELRARHTRLGVPTSRTIAVTVLERGEFVIGWDSALNAPRWALWSVTRADIGRAKRRNDFHADTDVPATMLRVGPQDYSQSGYDRGHLCPSGDRTASPERNHVTFLMTNMHAQRHALNAGPWEKLEEATRDGLKRSDDIAYVVAGALYTEYPMRIGRGVAVPSHSWKTVLWTKDGLRADQIPPNAPRAAVIMPNETAREDEPWQNYETSVAEIERRSGFRLPPN
jgi:endonuclease G, mitochondrial